MSETDVVPAEAAADAIPMEIVDIDGVLIVFTWYAASGADRLSLTAHGAPVGVAERLDSPEPKLLADRDMAHWLSANGRTDQILTAAGRVWRYRAEPLPSATKPTGN